MPLRSAIQRLAASRQAVCAALVVGIALRTLELLRNRSLWRDEASLALNILHLPFSRLLGSLEHDQAAPPLFLVVEKALTALLGTQELVLRLFPFLAGLSALFLFASLSRRILEDGPVRLYALGLFVITDSLIYYSAETKQFSTDVAATLWIWLCACRLLQAPGRWAGLGYGLSAALLPWLSNASVFVTIGTSVVLVWFSWRSGPPLRTAAFASLAFSLFSLALLYVTVYRHQPHNKVLDEYWAEAFAPLPPRSLSDLRWYFGAFFGLFTTPFGNGAKLYGMTSLAMLVGFVSLGRRRPTDVVLLLAPVLVTLLASGLRRYPFHGRLLLFLVPVVWIGVASGVLQLWQALEARARWIGVLFLLMLSGHPLLNMVDLLGSRRLKQEFRPVAQHLSERRRDGDVLYLSLASENPIRYYGERFELELEPLVVGTENDSVGPAFHRDLERVRGHGRVWFVIVPGDPNALESDVSVRVAMAALEALGSKLDQLDCYGVRLCLFDLDQGRGGSSAAR